MAPFFNNIRLTNAPLLGALLVGLLLNTVPALAQGSAKPAIEAAFSPGSAETLVLQAIQSARQSILVAAYSFTSKPIAEALRDAHQRGVQVLVVLDKSQLSERYTSATFLANSGIAVRIDSKHAIQHNKYLVIDQLHVQTGSFNYSASAVKRNAENVVFLKNIPNVARGFVADWTKHWEHAEPLAPRY